MPEPSRVEDPADARRVRALVVDLLEEAAAHGHTLLPQSWVIRPPASERLQPPCPLGENVLDATSSACRWSASSRGTKDGQPAYQVDRLGGLPRNHPPRGHRAASRQAARGRQRLARSWWTTGFRCSACGRIGCRARGAGADREGRCPGAALPLASLGADRVRPAPGRRRCCACSGRLPGVTERRASCCSRRPVRHASGWKSRPGSAGLARRLAQFLVRFKRYNGETGPTTRRPSARRAA